MKCFWLALLLAFPMALSAQDEEKFRRDLERNPRSIEIYIAYIRSLSSPQRINEVGNEAVNAVGGRFDIYTAIGDAFMNINDARRAVSAYQRAQALNPRSATGYNRMGQALLKTGAFRQAEVAFKAAASYTGSINARAGYLANVGLSLESSKEWQQAAQAYTEALKASPGNTAAKEGSARMAARLAPPQQ